ncbi:MAG: short-chain dehydrogenase/reductase [Alphaproteobacteria bacterium]
MELGLQGRHALVTGASKGIGRATALALASEGCDLTLVSRTQADLDTVASEIRASCNVQTHVVALDLAERGAIDRLFAGIQDLDILVNNAGAIPRGTLEDIEEDQWREVWELKVFGYINSCRKAYALMRARGSGVIINIIGAGGDRVMADYAAGAGGNASLMALTRALGGGSLRDGIRVVGINPGAIETERLVTLMQSAAERKFGDASRWRELMNPDFPPGQPEHIADMVAFLASDRSGNTTGTIITIDGGGVNR